MRPASTWLVLVIAAIVGVPTAAQRFETGATAVVVDVVVRDKSGRFVTALTPDDFTIAEDGVPQRITSLQLVGTPAPEGSTPSAPASSTAAAPEATAPEQPRFTALVFDRLEGESVNIARAGAAAAVANAGRSDVLAVFVIDGGLRMLQGFTTDKPRLTAAVDRAVQRAAMLISRERNGKRHDGGGTPAAVPGAEYAGGDDGSDALRGDRGAAGKLAEMSAIISRSTEMLERQFQGHWTTDALVTAGAALSTLPGRKTLIYFSDALAVPDVIAPRLDDVVATANRGQVTIYAVDTAGLRVGSQESAAAREVKAVGDASLAVNADGSSSSSLAMMERNEDALRRSPRVGMTMLSKPTGGFLIENTNDLAAGVRRIEADRRVHYLLTYAPARLELDGRWRAIDVSVKRRDVTVQARQGYVAVRSPGPLPVLVYEGPALAAIDQTPTPRAVPARVGAFAFPRPAPPRAGEADTQDVAVVVAAPAASVAFDVKGGSYRTDVTMLALIRDIHGRPIHKTSQPYRLAGPAADRARAMGGEMRFARTLPVTPGSYRAWGAVHDTASGRAGVAEWPLDVEGRGETGLGVSSLVVVSRLERSAGAAAAPRDPLMLGDMVLTPNLGEFLYRTPGAKLGLYFTVVGADAGEQLRARVQFFQNGIARPRPVLLEVPVVLSPAGADGTVRFIGQIPMEKVPLGSLEILLRVDRVDKTETRTAYANVREPRPDGANR
jgi:VWFA-related protein